MKKVSALLISGFSISLLLAGCQQNTTKSANAANPNEAQNTDAKSGDSKPLEEVRIGLQSSGALVYLRESKLLEKSLEKSGIKAATDETDKGECASQDIVNPQGC